MKRARIPGALCVVSFALFIVIYSTLAKDVAEGYMAWYAMLIGMLFLLPSACFFIISWLAYKGRLPMLISTIVSCGAAALYIPVSLCLVVIVALFCNNPSAPNAPTVNPADYTDRYEITSAVHGIFPEELPTNAENVIFDYAPPFWQGERHMLLMYEADADHLRAVEEKGDFTNLWANDAADREKLRLIMSSYFDTAVAPSAGALVQVSECDACLAVLILPQTNQVAYIYYVD